MSLIDSFRVSRWVRTINLVLQAILFFTLFSGLNYLAENHGWQDDPWRIDLTRARRYSLSPETVAYLKSLDRPVRIVVTESPDAVKPDLRGLLDEYVYGTESNPEGTITVRYLDVDLQRNQAQQLGLDQPGRVALFCADRPTLTVPVADLYRYDAQGPAAFNGEAVLTAALLNISSPERKKIYFLAGQGELQPGDVDATTGLSMAADLLRQRGFVVDTLDLSATAAIPEDASLVIAVSPRSPYSAREQETLRRYLATREGRMILFAAPGERPGFDSLLFDWGVRLDDDLVQDSGRGNVTEDGDLIVRWFTPHPVTQALFSANPSPRLRFGPARTVRPAAGRSSADGLDVATLAATSTTAWGEVNPALRRRRGFDPAVDIRPGPDSVPPDRLGLATASSWAAARDNLPFSVSGGRLVVVGCGDLIDNQRIEEEGVFDFFRGAVNWAVDRDRELTIPSRPLDRFQLSLSARELQNLHRSLLILIPGIAVLLGLIVCWTRRN